MKDLWIKIGCFITGHNYAIVNPTCARNNSLKNISFFIMLIINNIRNLVKIFSYSRICNTLIIKEWFFKSAL